MRTPHALCLFVFVLLTPFFLRTDPSANAQEKVVLDARFLDLFSARNIGPANMGGRIVDLAVVEKNPDTYYVAAATGGLWKTTDSGTTWTPLMDSITCSLGAVAVSQSNPDILYVGAGEANARNSVTWGDGVYRSGDGGKTWKHVGLKETQHIGRIVIHPTNPDIVYVAALGRLWGPNPERGMYMTSDGGKTWQHVLKLDANTGCIDVAIDPKEPDNLYAAAYQVRRDGFSGGNPKTQVGPKAGLYKSADAGKTWEKMTKGLPENLYGRCGVSIYAKDPKVVYAVVQTEKTPDSTAGQKANAKTELANGGIFRSDDRGATWTHLNSLVPRPFYYGQIRVDPSDDQRIYVLGTQFAMSTDGAKTFGGGGKGGGGKGGGKGGGTHPDHHAMWINPADPNHCILGNDGGLYVTKNRTASWTAIRGMPLAQFYGIAVDMRKPYRVYGGLQDNGSWGGPSQTRSELGIVLSDWVNLNGADGFQAQADPENKYVYVESQYGKPVRVDTSAGKGKGKSIGIKGGKADPTRFNWSAPMLLSPHDSKVLFYGGNYLFQSDERGDSWKKISGDLTLGKAGTTYASTGHTLSTITESPKKKGLIYVGSDDGRIHVTKDGGTTWIDLSGNVPNMPKDRWITRLECSSHDENTAYMTIGRHRNDDQKPYVFKTTDMGQTWQNITSNLPSHAPVHVVRESSKNPLLLFVGTEDAIHVTFDGGKYWYPFKAGLPKVPMHDLVIHPRDRDLVIGTHGRGVYVVDIGPLEEVSPKILAQSATLFNIRAALAYTPAKTETKAKSYVAPNAPVGATLHYHLKQPAKDVTITILDAQGKELTKFKAGGDVGLQRAFWNLRAGDGLVAPGEYTVQLIAGDMRSTQKLRVEAAE